MIHTNLTKEEWLKKRHLNVSSTESSALFGLSPYMTEFELYHQKRSPEPYTIEENFRMKCGTLMEPVIAQLTLDEIGCEGKEFKDYLDIPEIRMGSSFDWTVTSGEYKGWLIECKNVDFLVYRDNWTENEAPMHIEVQVQHQMHVADRPGCIIACFMGGNELKLIFRERDELFGKALAKKTAEFWERVAKNDEPEINFDRDSQFIQMMYNKSVKDKVFADFDDPELPLLLSDYKECTTEIKKIEGLKDAIKAKVFMTADDAGVLMCNGYKVSLGNTKDTPAKTIKVTPEMVGQEIELSKARNGYRMFKVTEKSNPKNQEKK